jgi:hypothetical protein
MPRLLSPTFLAQLAGQQVMPVYFVELAFADNTYYIFSGQGSLTPAGPPYSPLATFPYGETFIGVGWLGKIAKIPQTKEIQAQSVELSLSGIPSSLIAEAIGQVRITGTATIWLGFFNTSTDALIADPVQVFSGALDVPTSQDAGETSTLTITAENTLLSLNQAPNRQFEDADQQIYFPGDLGMSFIDTLSNLALFWPSPANYSNPFPVDIIMSPNNADIAVGGTVTIDTTINYSDTSSYTQPSGSGSGQPFLAILASTNPKVATVSGLSGIVTGRSPGVAVIVVRSMVGSTGATIPYAARRCSCTVIVHS